MSEQKDLSKLSTKEFASYFRVEPQTIRRALCVDGHYLGIKPLKLPNHRLLWAKSDADRMLEPGR
jgi:hypothetical protein